MVIRLLAVEGDVVKTMSTHCPGCGVGLQPNNSQSWYSQETGAILRIRCVPTWKPGKHWGCGVHHEHLHWKCPQCKCEFTTSTATQLEALAKIEAT